MKKHYQVYTKFARQFAIVFVKPTVTTVLLTRLFIPSTYTNNTLL